MIEHVVNYLYIVSAALFILALKWMNKPESARRSVMAGEIGMLLAVVGTLLKHDVVNYQWILIAFDCALYWLRLDFPVCVDREEALRRGAKDGTFGPLDKCSMRGRVDLPHGSIERQRVHIDHQCGRAPLMLDGKAAHALE